MHGKAIEYSEVVKVLGVRYDDKLRFIKAAEHCVNLLHKYLRIAKHVRH